MTHTNENRSHLTIKTDETIREIVSHGSKNYPFQYYIEDIWEFDLHCVDWHWHPELEFVYIEKGTANVFVGSNTYTLSPGQGIFINSQVVHRFESNASTIIPNIVFSPFLLASKESLIYQKYMHPILNSKDCQIFSPQISWQNEILELLKIVFAAQKKEETCELETVEHLLKLWQILYTHMNISHPQQSYTRDAQNQARLQLLLQYIYENYQHAITLEDLAKEISLSKSSVLNLFNTYIQMSPIDYIIHYKMKQAAHLLETTENTVLSISQSLGFENIGYFCRKFKEIFKLTPSQYRKVKP